MVSTTYFNTLIEIAEEDWAEQWALFFSKGQSCFRASPLTKRHGWGIHSNAEGKIAMYKIESEAYRRFVADKSVIKKKTMRSIRA